MDVQLRVGVCHYFVSVLRTFVSHILFFYKCLATLSLEYYENYSIRIPINFKIHTDTLPHDHYELIHIQISYNLALSVIENSSYQ